MTTALIATVLLTRQNPNPPSVRLLPGWSHGSWGETKHGQGSLKGPNRLEVGYPHYGSAGEMASSLWLLDRDAFYLGGAFDERLVRITLMSDGLLAVSFARAEPHFDSSSSSFDYWATIGRR